MNKGEKMRVGLIGGGRGLCLRNGIEASGDMKVVANCDINPEQNEAVREKWGITELYNDYETMLDKGNLDVVFIATPMHLHVPMAVAALDRDLHVISEVTAAVSLEQCRELVRAAKASTGRYVMAENGLYIKEVALVRELVTQGLFGTPYYAEGEYLHNLRVAFPRKPHWRRIHGGVSGVTYGSHELGPILSWLPGDRVVSVCCAGTGRHYTDDEGKPFEQEDSSVMLCRLRSGGLVKIRMDIMSNRPPATINYMLQGTDGCFESGRENKGGGRLWLKSRCEDEKTWLDIKDLEADFLPQVYHALADVMKKDKVHLGNDCMTGAMCVEMLLGRIPSLLDVHHALDMTIPGLMSVESVAQGGSWVDVPDSREW